MLGGPPVILIAPIGEAPVEVLRELLPAIERRFPGRTAQLAERALARPDDACVSARGQYRAEPIIERLRALRAEAERVVGVADLDLYTPGLNFIFGLADAPGPVAVVALARLRPEFWGGPADRHLLVERAIKEVVHELGHTYGLGHCRRPACVMRFSNTLGETDAKSDRFCPEHEAELRRALDRAG